MSFSSGPIVGRRDWLRLAAGAAASSASFASRAWADPDIAAIVRTSDTARGGGLPGIYWAIHVVSSGNDDATDGERDMEIKASSKSSLADTLTPVRFRGTKLLQVDHNMWLSRPGLQKPIPISTRQRLSGLAANGDIAATNYANDYSASLLRSDAFHEEPCYVIELASKNRGTTYDRIVYWVSVQRNLAVNAQFLAVSGKPLKSATFEYNNSIDAGARTIPFISKMTITDALTPARTVLEYHNVQVVNIPDSLFDINSFH
jgi:hypothetical protein